MSGNASCRLTANSSPFRIAADLPVALQAAAHDYATDAIHAGDEPQCGNDANTRRLFAALGEVAMGNAAHRRVAALCVFALRRVLARQAAQPVERELQATVDQVARWIVVGQHGNECRGLACSSVPQSRGGTTCDENEVLCAAVAALARFCDSASEADALTALNGAAVCDNPEARWVRTEMLFDDWVVTIALPAAWNLSELSNERLHPLMLARAMYPPS